MQRKIRAVVSVLFLMLVLPGTGSAESITYNYAGNSFTDFSTCNTFGIPDACSATNIFRTYNFVIASVTLDVSIGEAAAGLTPTFWAISTGPTPLLQGYGAPVYASSTNVIGCVLCNGSGGSFDVDESGMITNWTLVGRSGWADTNVRTSNTFDRAFWDAGLPYGASVSNSPGIWSIVSVPEPSPLTLLLVGLVSIIGVGARWGSVISFLPYRTTAASPSAS